MTHSLPDARGAMLVCRVCRGCARGRGGDDGLLRVERLPRDPQTQQRPLFPSTPEFEFPQFGPPWPMVGSRFVQVHLVNYGRG